MLTNTISELAKFESLSLDEMDRVKLMNRKETKFTVNAWILPDLLSEFKEDYYVLEIMNRRIAPYKSVYFDTRDFDFYRTHQNGKLNRYKVRQRTYETTGRKFLETKFKTNRKRTIKKRIEISDQWGISFYEGFLGKNIPPCYSFLEEKIVVRYNRITLVDRSFHERVTIDLNLSYSTFTRESEHDELVIIEIKHGGDLKLSPVYTKLAERKIKPLSFSKYCLGISEHYPQVKSNLMNLKMRKIRKSLSSSPDGPEYQKAEGI